LLVLLQKLWNWLAIIKFKQIPIKVIPLKRVIFLHWHLSALLKKITPFESIERIHISTFTRRIKKASNQGSHNTNSVNKCWTLLEKKKERGRNTFICSERGKAVNIIKHFVAGLRSWVVYVWRSLINPPYSSLAKMKISTL
jgi:hypothetical protein